jgi:hypothetical protein
MIKVELLLSLLIVMISVPSGIQIQIYDSAKAPIRLRLTSADKNIEVVNHSDQRVDALSFGCVSESPNGKVLVKSRVESIENFDLKHIDLPPADTKKSIFSFFSFPATEKSVRECTNLGQRLAIVEVVFENGSIWKISEP